MFLSRRRISPIFEDIARVSVALGASESSTISVSPYRRLHHVDMDCTCVLVRRATCYYASMAQAVTKKLTRNRLWKRRSCR